MINSHKPKVCFLVTDAVSFNVLCAGQLEYFRDVAGWDMTFVSGGCISEIDQLKSRNVGKVIRIGFQRKPDLMRDFLDLFSVLWFFLWNRFDLVVYSTPKALLLGSVGAFLTMQRSRIAIIRGRAYENFKGFRRFFFGAMDRLALALSHDVIFISRSLRDAYIREFLVKPQFATVLGQGSSNGVAISRFKQIGLQERKELRKHFGLGIWEEDFIVVVIGRICRDKGVEDSARVIDALEGENVKFLFVGRIEDEVGRQVLQDLSLRHPKTVKYFGHTKDIEKLFQCSNIHLFLSHREGFGNVAVEAAACGIPTVAYNVVGVSDSVLDGVSGAIFDKGDVQGIARFILECSNSHYIGNQIFLSTRDWAVQNYASERVWENYRTHYERYIH